jgi:hypothetical protein
MGVVSPFAVSQQCTRRAFANFCSPPIARTRTPASGVRMVAVVLVALAAPRSSWSLRCNLGRYQRPLLSRNPIRRSITASAAAEGMLETTTLPDSFDASVALAVESTLTCRADGWLKLRVDFDTSQGDETYTKLKSSMPFTQKFIAQIVTDLLAGEADQSNEEEDSEPAADAKTVRLYFPDAGSAALAQRDWKVGTAESLVPDSVRFASLSRDRPAATDGAIIFICPRASEVDFLKVVLRDVEDQDMPLIFINPGKLRARPSMKAGSVDPCLTNCVAAHLTGTAVRTCEHGCDGLRRSRSNVARTAD